MKNMKQAEGCTVEVTAPVDLNSGDGVLIGKLFGVANFTVKAGQRVNIYREGIYNLPKTSAQAWGEGDPLYWDGTKATTSSNSGANTLIGYAAAVAANPSAFGDVLIHQ